MGRRKRKEEGRRKGRVRAEGKEGRGKEKRTDKEEGKKGRGRKEEG